MSRLTDLIAQAKAPQPGADLHQEFKQRSSSLPFGLNLARCRPEAVELPQRPNGKGDKVRVLPPRGSAKKCDSPLLQIHEQPRPYCRTGALIACGLGGVLRLSPVQPTTLPGSPS